MSGNDMHKVSYMRERLLFAAGERRSKRVRRGEAEVKASSSNTLWDFKLRLVEALNIHPRNAEVHIRVGDAWQKLTNDEETLAGDCGCWTLLFKTEQRPTGVGGRMVPSPYHHPL